MEEPFDIFIGPTTYSVFPEEDNTFTIFKEGKENLKSKFIGHVTY